MAIATVSKTVTLQGVRGFESHLLRQRFFVNQYVPIFQRIECELAEFAIEVRFLLGTQVIHSLHKKNEKSKIVVT